MYPLLLACIKWLSPGGIVEKTRLRQLERNQWKSRDELAAIQLRAIRHLIHHAYAHVPFYRKRFNQIGVHPHDIKTFEDFHRLPVLTRGDIRANLKSMLATNIPQRSVWRDSTGGSTGEPLFFYVTKDWRRWNTAAGARAGRWYGYRLGSKEAWIWGAQRDLPDEHWTKRLRDRVNRQRWLNSYGMGRDHMQSFARDLLGFSPTFIFGYVSSIYLFARYLDKAGINGIRPRFIETAAEKLHDFQRALIERVFNCPVIDYYASRESGCIAAQCLSGGMHVADDVRYVEIVTNGRAPEPGHVGEVILTDLTHYAMPFIRYRNGDLAIGDTRPCPCGRGLSLLQEVVGRTTDIFTMPNGKWISGLFFSALLRNVTGIERFQVYQPSKDTIEISITASSAGVDETSLGTSLKKIKDHIGLGIRLFLKRVTQIQPTPAGKHLFLRSEVPVDFGSGTQHTERRADS